MGASGMLTDVELELMTILWRIGPATVREVIEALPAGRNLAYTSVSTMLRILTRKGFVTSAAVPRTTFNLGPVSFAHKTHRYTPAIEKRDYEGRSLSHIVNGLFEGDPKALVRSLIETSDLDPDELASIKKLLDRKAKR